LSGFGRKADDTARLRISERASVCRKGMKATRSPCSIPRNQKTSDAVGSVFDLAEGANRALKDDEGGIGELYRGMIQE